MNERRTSFRDIKSELERRIARRVWPPGAIMPGEEALAAEFGAARATVNRALQELARSGLIERKRKSGTRVALYPVREARLAIPLVRKEIEAKGARYAYSLLGREIVAAPDFLRARLDLPETARVLHLRCLHLADRAPFQYEERWISLDAVPDAADEPFDETGPNEWLVANAPFSRAEFVFRAARAGREEAALLQLVEGEAVFIGERMTWLADRPITFVRMVHPPSHRMVTEI
ncbi:UTRA domain-containing protein [Nitratireductor mangrovi]|uniref:UTRA domain-containing protein n=1 Tax=Nitratireductor mangrovi TaxID=2599600 RepID=A0A5B8L212_9HYPH|nr:GntR family transcriptional regulator [Nitratireductor mangrovi]QDZ01889.1 UTRA domain-containing protein [Nitratireductor mangrovi]